MIEFWFGFLSSEIIFCWIFLYKMKKALKSKKIMLEARLRILDKLCNKDKIVYIKEFLDWEIQDIKEKL